MREESIFDQLSRPNADCAEAVQQHEKDMREAMRLLMTRREGRVFVRRTLESTNDITHLRGVSLMVMDYMEATHG